MPEWSETNPLRVVTGYHNIARRFFKEKGFEHVVLLSADGALEAAPLMGSADIILDLVSTLSVPFSNAPRLRLASSCLPAAKISDRLCPPERNNNWSSEILCRQTDFATTFQSNGGIIQCSFWTRHLSGEPMSCQLNCQHTKIRGTPVFSQQGRYLMLDHT